MYKRQCDNNRLDDVGRGTPSPNHTGDPEETRGPSGVNRDDNCSVTTINMSIATDFDSSIISGDPMASSKAFKRKVILNATSKPIATLHKLDLDNEVRHLEPALSAMSSSPSVLTQIVDDACVTNLSGDTDQLREQIMQNLSTSKASESAHNSNLSNDMASVSVQSVEFLEPIADNGRDTKSSSKQGSHAEQVTQSESEVVQTDVNTYMIETNVLTEKHSTSNSYQQEISTSHHLENSAQNLSRQNSRQKSQESIAKSLEKSDNKSPFQSSPVPEPAEDFNQQSRGEFNSDVSNSQIEGEVVEESAVSKTSVQGLMTKFLETSMRMIGRDKSKESSASISTPSVAKNKRESHTSEKTVRLDEQADADLGNIPPSPIRSKSNLCSTTSTKSDHVARSVSASNANTKSSYWNSDTQKAASAEKAQKQVHVYNDQRTGDANEKFNFFPVSLSASFSSETASKSEVTEPKVRLIEKYQVEKTDMNLFETLDDAGCGSRPDLFSQSASPSMNPVSQKVRASSRSSSKNEEHTDRSNSKQLTLSKSQRDYEAAAEVDRALSENREDVLPSRQSATVLVSDKVDIVQSRNSSRLSEDSNCKRLFKMQSETFSDINSEKTINSASVSKRELSQKRPYSSISLDKDTNPAKLFLPRRSKSAKALKSDSETGATKQCLHSVNIDLENKSPDSREISLSKQRSSEMKNMSSPLPPPVMNDQTNKNDRSTTSEATVITDEQPSEGDNCAPLKSKVETVDRSEIGNPETTPLSQGFIDSDYFTKAISATNTYSSHTEKHDGILEQQNQDLANSAPDNASLSELYCSDNSRTANDNLSQDLRLPSASEEDQILLTSGKFSRSLKEGVKKPMDSNDLSHETGFSASIEKNFDEDRIQGDDKLSKSPSHDSECLDDQLFNTAPGNDSNNLKLHDNKEQTQDRIQVSYDHENCKNNIEFSKDDTLIPPLEETGSEVLQKSFNASHLSTTQKAEIIHADVSDKQLKDYGGYLSEGRSGQNSPLIPAMVPVDNNVSCNSRSSTSKSNKSKRSSTGRSSRTSSFHNDQIENEYNSRCEYETSGSKTVTPTRTDTPFVKGEIVVGTMSDKLYLEQSLKCLRTAYASASLDPSTTLSASLASWQQESESRETEMSQRSNTKSSKTSSNSEESILSLSASTSQQSVHRNESTDEHEDQQHHKLVHSIGEQASNQSEGIQASLHQSRSLNEASTKASTPFMSPDPMETSVEQTRPSTRRSQLEDVTADVENFVKNESKDPSISQRSTSSRAKSSKASSKSCKESFSLSVSITQPTIHQEDNSGLQLKSEGNNQMAQGAPLMFLNLEEQGESINSSHFEEMSENDLTPNDKVLRPLFSERSRKAKVKEENSDYSDVECPSNNFVGGSGLGFYETREDEEPMQQSEKSTSFPTEEQHSQGLLGSGLGCNDSPNEFASGSYLEPVASNASNVEAPHNGSSQSGNESMTTDECEPKMVSDVVELNPKNLSLSFSASGDEEEVEEGTGISQSNNSHSSISQS